MTLAVEDGDTNVLHRETAERSTSDDLEDALFHSGNELSGDRAAFHGVDEFEAGASRQWLHAQHHFTELPGAAGLLLVAIMPLGPGADRFPISDLRWPRHNLELVLLGQPL